MGGQQHEAGVGKDYGNKATVVIGETSLLYGKYKNFFEPGFTFQYPVSYYYEGSEDAPLLALRLGYRHLGLNGFQFRVYPMIIFILGESDDWSNVLPRLGLSFGYAF